MPSPRHCPTRVSDDVYCRSVPLMGTIVTIQVVGHAGDVPQKNSREHTVERSFEWFRQVEQRCTRFEPKSEVMQLASQIGVPVPVSEILFEAVRFALVVAEESGAAFDPTVGYAMESRGFNREYRTAGIIRTSMKRCASISYRDVRLEQSRKSIMLLRPLILDLGAVAKGLAIDLAARELLPLQNFAIDAGGDLYLGGSNTNGEPWAIGIRHPRRDNELIDSLSVSNCAVCTSGDYERRNSSEPEGHHILDPRTGASAHTAASVTVVAQTAMVADALSTAAFVLGPADGTRLLERMGVDGLIFSPALERYTTSGLSRWISGNRCPKDDTKDVR